MRRTAAYLVLYNSTQAVGWASVLYLTARSILAHGSAAYVFEAAGPVVKAFQAAALMETAHAAVGMVGGSPVAALMQWAGRSNLLLAVVDCIPELWSSPVIAVLFTAWALSEVIRYPWYAATLLGGAPHALTWLRYTAFYVLYPVGLLSEMWLLYSGLPAIAARQLHSVLLPNSWNWAFSYYVAMMGLLVLYPFLWWPLYSLLISQRRKKLKSA